MEFVDRKMEAASRVYCSGPLLEAVQNAEIFKDSKTFVDMHIKSSPEKVLEAFAQLEDPNDPEVIRAFVNTHFDGPNDEFEAWIPTDWKARPRFLQNIKDGTLRDWAQDLHWFWKQLGRQIKSDVAENQDQYSLLYCDHPFIVPGGRFREFYYWDSYWIIKGLLLSEMTDTVRGMILNFVQMLDMFGFVPNGNRIYYTNRSQPPYLIPSVYEYLKSTKDVDFVKTILPSLEREYMFWMTHRCVGVRAPGSDRVHMLNRYCVDTDQPRPESFSEDRETYQRSVGKSAANLYSHIASAAESGWDFSSRWLEENQSDLASSRAKEIIPVDLNSVMCLNEKMLAEFFAITGQPEKAEQYMSAYRRRRAAIQEVFWDSNIGTWLDFDVETGRHRNEFYPSNLLPLWVDSFGEEASDMEVGKVLTYLKNTGVLDFTGGIPTSLADSGQQWDFPNAWPPLQEMLIQALASSRLPEAQNTAFQMAQRWIATNSRAYQAKRVMYEKYNAERVGDFGDGGEYEVQVGFGWTNGVVLTLLDKYGDRLSAEVETRLAPPVSLSIPPNPNLNTEQSAIHNVMLS